MNLPLFGDESAAERILEGAPLAERMRPRSLDALVGQVAVIGPQGFLRRALAEDRLPSIIFWGPPGCGKTTLARIIAEVSESLFVPFSAVTSGIKEIRQVMKDAARLRRGQGRRTLLFVDEIHRFNKAQQDAFLPFVESGEIVLIGATTENPSFEVIGALLSRCRVVVLDPLTSQDVATLVRRALEDVELGLGGSRVTISQEAVETISQLSSGDARRALNLLELCVADLEPGSELDATAVAAASQRKVLLYDKAGEEHFNLISALHKSLRESDADASLYWLYRMLEAGEDPRYLARRMVRFASEDIGLADPGALRQSLDAWEAFDRLGPPEGLLALAQAAIYLALAPKSIGVYQASKETLRSIAENPAEGVPLEIRNAPTRLMKEVGYGDGYVYAPDTEEGVGGLECLPENLRGSRFYQPRDSGWEKELRRRILELEEKRGRARD